jgi:signal transduction histidine kinase
MTTLHDKTNDPDSSALSVSNEGDPHSHQESLRSKLVLSLAAVFLIFLMIDEVVRCRVIEPQFVALETAGAIRDANRVLGALNSEVEHLIDLGTQWASWIDESETVSPGSNRPVRIGESNPWAAQKLDWAALVTPDGSWSCLSCKTVVEYSSLASSDISGRFSMLVRSCQESKRPTWGGMTRFGNNSLVAFAVVALDDPSRDSGDPQPQRYFVVGRKIDDKTVAELHQQTQVAFTLQPPRTTDPTQKVVVWEANLATLMVEVQLTGMNDERLANVLVSIPRDVTARSRRATALARNTFVFGSAAALLILLLLLQRIVVGRLIQLREFSDRVAEQGFAAEPLKLTEQGDEIGQLAIAFDHTVGRLREAQTKLSKASQAEGRSQVASAVIHNVGNVLTNVNSLLNAATSRVDGLRIGPLDKLASRLQNNDSDEGLLAETPKYLEGLAGTLKTDQVAIREMLATLHDNIQHIHDVIRDQQQHTDTANTTSSVNLRDIVQESIACCQARLEQDMISVEISGQLQVDVRSDGSLLLQTMINIIGNARHAMQDVDPETRRLGIDVHTLEDESIVRIEFCDNGCGMTEQMLERIFDAYFTTRENGSGLGLHFCAITLKRLDGSIYATSDGPGQGSTFVMELPRHHPVSAEADSNQDLASVSVGAD